MNRGLDSLLRTLSDPAPGLLFGAHKAAGLGKRAYASAHVAGGALDGEGLERLRSLCGGMQNALGVLVDLYSLHNGLRMYRFPPRSSAEESWGVELYPFEVWEEKTAAWKGEDLAWLFEGVTLYELDTWRVIGSFGSGSQSIVMFFGGVWGGGDQAGRCYCIGVDGMLGFEEMLAVDFGTLAGRLCGKRIVQTFDTVGVTGFIETGRRGGHIVGYGDVIAEYLPDVRRSRHLVG